MATNTIEQQAKQLLDAVGGKGNVISVFHCMTRLRFNLKDTSIPKVAEVKKIEGVMGAQFSGGQFQIIIGLNVDKVYSEICKIGDFTSNDLIEESGEKPKEKRTLKSVGNSILNGLSGSITPALPVFITSGLLKMLVIIFGPGMLGWMGAESGILTILTFSGDAGFYFLPIILAYTSAKQFKANPIIAMLFGGILIHPVLIGLVTEGKPLEMVGLPILSVNYSSSVLPIILIVFIMSYVERFLTKYIPDMFKIMLVPLLTVLVMLPIGLGILGPLGNVLGEYVGIAFLWIHSVFGPFGIGLIAALFTFLVVTGMHHPLNIASMVTMASVGYDSVVFVAATATIFATSGVALAFAIKAKETENKALGFSAFTLQTLVGVAEPTIFGIMLPYRKPFIAQALGAFSGAVYMGIMGVKMFALTGSSMFVLAGFVSSDMANLLHAVIGSVIAFVVSFMATYFLGFKEQ